MNKNIIRILILIPIGILILYSMWYAVDYNINGSITDCGMVVSRSNDEVPIKHGTLTKLYLNVQFDSVGFRSILCEPTTYFSKGVGDTVCFEVEPFPEKRNCLYAIGMTSICLLSLILATSILVFLLYEIL